MLIKYIKSVLWRVAKRLSYIEDARRLKVKYCTLQNFTKLMTKKTSAVALSTANRYLTSDAL